jgi:hypothetical protein
VIQKKGADASDSMNFGRSVGKCPVWNGINWENHTSAFHKTKSRIGLLNTGNVCPILDKLQDR